LFAALRTRREAFARLSLHTANTLTTLGIEISMHRSIRIKAAVPRFRPFKSRRVFLFTLCFGTSWYHNSAVEAADVTKADNTTPLNISSSWIGGSPTSSDVGVWDSTVTSANTTVSIGGNLTLGGIRIANPGGAITITADGAPPNSALTLGSSGI